VTFCVLAISITLFAFSALANALAALPAESSSFSLAYGSCPIVLDQMSCVLRDPDVDIRLLWGILTRPEVAGMLEVFACFKMKNQSTEVVSEAAVVGDLIERSLV